MKLIIIGGVAGGAGAAARARRLDENAEIIMLEKGSHVSFANCGLPYHVGGVIKNRESLFVVSAEAFRGKFNIDVRLRSKAVKINAAAKTVTVKSEERGEYEESYDKLVMATGSVPATPPYEGASLPDVVPFWTLKDMDRVMEKINAGAKDVTVVGAGFVGMELVENFVHRGMRTTLLHRSSHPLSAFLDAEMSRPIVDVMNEKGVETILDNEIKKITPRPDSPRGARLLLKDGAERDTDLLIVCTGVRPNSGLAKDAGLKIGATGGVVVDEFLRTSDPDIYAVGDVIEVADFVTGRPALRQLAGPANKQGRVAADNIFGGKKKYNGTIGASIIKMFELSAASTGHTEAFLKKSGIDFLKTYVVPASHASYYPGASPLFIKMLFGRDGKILGGQIVGREGVDKHIDVLSTAIRAGLTTRGLEELELSYAPPYSSAKDPLNQAAFTAGNILDDVSRVVSPDAIPPGAFLLDVREPAEFSSGAIPGAVNMPVGDLRGSLARLPKDKKIVVYCRSGMRGYNAERILRQKGFDAANLPGGYLVWRLFNPPPAAKGAKSPASGGVMACGASCGIPSASVRLVAKASRELDVRGLQCPGPIVRIKGELDKMSEGETLRAVAEDPGFLNDIKAWCASSGNTLASLKNEGGEIEAVITKGAAAAPALGTATEGSATEKGTTIVVFSNDLDKAMAAFIIALGAASLGHKVGMFFTFWGLNVIRKDNPPPVKKDFMSRMFGMMMPRGAKKLALSKMNMMGMGTAMMKDVMKKKNVSSLPELIGQAREMGVRLIACEMAMNVMGIQKEELLDGVDVAGVAQFISLSEKSRATLFI